MKQDLTSLVLRSQQGDAKAQNDLMGAVYNDLYYFALKTVQVEKLAADILMESCLEMVTTLKTLRDPAAFRCWALKIVYRHCARCFESSEEAEEGEAILDAWSEESSEAPISPGGDSQEVHDAIISLIDKLSPEQRSAIMLYYYEELSVGEIAEIQDTSEETAKRRINYARREIRNLLESYKK